MKNNKMFTLETRDKLDFKQLCIECGIPTPIWYHMEECIDPSVLDKMKYPVMVKPSDVSVAHASCVCNNEEEFLEAYNQALFYSIKRKILVEEYIEGQKMVLTCYVSHGSVRNRQDLPEIFTNMVEKLLQKQGISDGVFFFDVIRRGEDYYFVDSGMWMERVG